MPCQLPFVVVSVRTNEALAFVLATMICAGGDVPVAPPLVVAFAVKTYVPAGAFDHVKLYGAVRSSPSLVVPRKNSTLVIDPVGVLAVAFRTTFGGAM